MKKFTIKSLALTLAITLLATTANTIPAQAKASPKLSYKTDELCAPSWDLKGTSVQFKVKNAGGKKVTWKSSNKKVVTVSKTGLVKAVKRGNVTISAKVGKKTLTKRVYVHKHTFDYYNPSEGCQYCKHETPSCFYSVKTARRDLEQFIKDITSPGKTSPEEVLFNFHEWEGELYCPTIAFTNEDTSYWEKPNLPQSAYKYIPDWTALEGLDIWSDFDEVRDKILDDWCKPRYDKYGQQIPRVTMAEESFAKGYTGVCQEYAHRAFLMAHMLGLETCLIRSDKFMHRICLYKLNGKWILDDNGNWESGWDNGTGKDGQWDTAKYVTKEDFKKGGRLEPFYRITDDEADLLEEIAELSSDAERKAYEKANKDLPADLRP